MKYEHTLKIPPPLIPVYIEWLPWKAPNAGQRSFLKFAWHYRTINRLSGKRGKTPGVTERQTLSP